MDIYNFFFPDYCIYCGKESKLPLCSSCLYKFKKHKLTNRENYCNKCNHLLRDSICYFCSSRYVFFDKLIALYEYNTFTKPILWEWKYQNYKDVYKLFVKDLIKIIQLEKPNRIGYISSHNFGKNYRSYDVLEALVKKLNSLTNIPYGKDILKIKKIKQSQKKQEDRFFEILFSFQLTKKFPLINKYLLVEDLVTTGATINEVARLLKEKGIKNITVVSIFFEDFIEESIWNPYQKVS